MTVQIKVPVLGESVAEATVAKWYKRPGDPVAVDEPLVELETDKVTVEVNSPVVGVLATIIVPEGTDVEVNALLGTIEEGAVGSISPDPGANSLVSEGPARIAVPAPAKVVTPALIAVATRAKPLSPAVRKLIDENNIDVSLITPTGKDARITKGDVLAAIEVGLSIRRVPVSAPTVSTTTPLTPNDLPQRPDDPREERVRMSKLRKIISGRLKEAQNTAAMLTTWNEVDMGAVMDLRVAYKDVFEKKHGVRLGFMSFFVRAACIALKEFPALNAEIYGDEQIYKNFYNIGVAVGTPQGLVVPVLKDADGMRFSEIEGTIGDFGRRARDGKLSMNEMSGGTFTITNGGVFGSLNSMPILNVPQSAILGMHKIQKRPVAVNDEVVIRPMMYLAMSYDHRIVDGREAVSFLVRIKDLIEDPQRIMLDV
jgi:2-oxoglutarate dehydrogenase E2 component (dihydrolipoamide succinyltransferase)